MASHNNLCIDLQYVLDKIDVLRKLPFVEQHLSSEDREELDRMWREQEDRGIAKATASPTAPEALKD